MPKQPPIFTLDITTRDRYLANVEQYGMAALKPPLAEVHIVVPTDLDIKQRIIGSKNDTITLFVAPEKDNYIIGFRGANQEPYCLPDAANVDSFHPLLAAALDVPKDSIKASKIRADHRALSSFARAFEPADLVYSYMINQFTNGREDLRRYIALMVAMVAEGARMKSTRIEFADLYDGKSVAIDEGRVKSYGKARAIMALADEKRIDRAAFVAKLHSLRALIDAGRSAAEAKTGSPVHQHGLIAWIYGTRNPALDNVKGIDKARIRQIIDDLGLNTEQATDMLTKIADADVGRNVDELAKRAGKTS